MGSKLGTGTKHFHVNKGHVKMQDNVKRFKHLEKVFHIDLKEYGGTMVTAEEQILKIFDSIDGKTKVKKLVISPEKNTHLYRVTLNYKVSI